MSSRRLIPPARTWRAAGLAVLASLATAASASASQLDYYGGPVVHSANLVLVKWGSNVRSAYTDAMTGDPGLFRYLASQNGSTSDIGGVLAQYMDSTGHDSQNHFGFAGTFQINPTVATSVHDSNIHTALTNGINGGSLPAPAGDGMSTIYVVLFPPGVNVCFDASEGGGCAYDATNGFCAYHGSFPVPSSTHVLYTAMVDNGPGTTNYGYCGGSASDMANQTAVVTHEVGEAINDPLVAEAPLGWGPPLGWYDPTFDGEIADKCDAQPLASNGPWTVEPLWSNLDGKCLAGESAYSAPTASFLAPGGAIAGQQASFDASSSSDPAANHTSAFEQDNSTTYSMASGITSYHWNWGDGSASTTTTSPAASHGYTATGNYEVSLTVTDHLGFTSTKTQLVTVASDGSLAPVPSTGPATSVGSQDATLTGTLNPENEAVSYQFLYGTSPSSLTSSTPLTAGPTGSSAVPVSATVSGLAASTTYYYELVATASGQTATGSTQSFMTTASATERPTPSAATGPAEQVTPTDALLTGTVNPGGSASVQYRFSYGTSATKLAHHTTQRTEAGGTTAVAVNALLGGLKSRVTYYFRLDVSLNGHTYSGSVRSFSTPAPLPGVSTRGASSVTSSSAVVSGWVNPHGTSTIYQVQFGSSRAYGLSTPFIAAGSRGAGRAVNLVLVGLHPQTTYHYRLVAQGTGGTAVGADHTFTTARRLYGPRFRFRTATRVSRRRLIDHLRVRFECSKACTAHFVLTTVRGGIAQTGAVPLAIGRGMGRLRGAGTGVATLRLSRRAARAHWSKRGPTRLVLLGYAVARGNAASAPRAVRIRLS